MNLEMRELFTIGYEGSSQEGLFKTLLFHDIETLLDIRELPQSRKPGFSKKALELAAPEFGIKYAHVKELGTPRDIRYQRKVDHDQQAFREEYLKHLATQDEAMRALVTRIESEHCCLMCFEADPGICHRSIVAERAVEMAGGTLTVIDLTVEP